MVPNHIVARHRHAFLVRWLGGSLEESSFESVYFLLPYGRAQLLNFLLDSLNVKSASLFHLIGLPLESKSWIDSDPTNVVKGRLGEYRKLVATPPYLLLNNKNLYDF